MDGENREIHQHNWARGYYIDVASLQLITTVSSSSDKGPKTPQNKGCTLVLWKVNGK